MILIDEDQYKVKSVACICLREKEKVLVNVTIIEQKSRPAENGPYACYSIKAHNFLF